MNSRVPENALPEEDHQPPKRRLNLDTPIVPSTGKPFDLTNDEIHILIELP